MKQKYFMMKDIIDKVPKRDYLFVIGDLNVRIGNVHSSYPSCVGKNTIGISND